jgi:hypothetical protein
LDADDENNWIIKKIFTGILEYVHVYRVFQKELYNFESL